jgi:hypothetical protein
MYGLKFLISVALRRVITKITMIAAANTAWTAKNPQFFHCETLPRQTVSSGMPDF